MYVDRQSSIEIHFILSYLIFAFLCFVYNLLSMASFSCKQKYPLSEFETSVHHGNIMGTSWERGCKCTFIFNFDKQRQKSNGDKNLMAR